MKIYDGNKITIVLILPVVASVFQRIFLDTSEIICIFWDQQKPSLRKQYRRWHLQFIFYKNRNRVFNFFLSSSIPCRWARIPLSSWTISCAFESFEILDRYQRIKLESLILVLYPILHRLSACCIFCADTMTFASILSNVKNI